MKENKMRIVQVGKFHFPQGGADKYFLDLSHALEMRGHRVARFSLQHPKNEPSSWASYFAPRVYFSSEGLGQKLLAVGRRLYSGFISKRLFRKLVRDFRPDVIHVHNICHYLSPSFLAVAKQYDIPVVMHLHDYSLLSPNYLLFNEKGDYHGGKKERYFECVTDRCFKHSYVQSFLVALEMFWQQRILQIFKKSVTVFVAPSRCMREQVRLWRPDIQNVTVIPHGVVIQSLIPHEELLSNGDPYFLYVGRLSSEKGVGTLVYAFSQLREKNMKLKIVGDGPEREKLEALVRKLHIEDRVTFLGFRSGRDLETLIEQSIALVVPSEWKEVFGLVVIEGMERGKVVIASRVGAIPEIIEHEKSGLLFTKSDAGDLVRKMGWVVENPSLAQEIGNQARARVEQQYSYSQHIANIETLYQEILEGRKKTI